MKKIVASFAAFFLAVSMPVLFAQMPLGVPMTAGISPDLTRIGVVAAAGGKVQLTTPGQVGRIAQSGQAIFMGDEVKTDAEGHLQILLLDETVFTIGPNSAIIIDKFVYDPKSHSGEIKASITKGVFRYVSGKIAAKDPDSVKVKLPTATLGFRGTIVGGAIDASGQGLVGLLGPGDNNDAGAQSGSFTATGTGGGDPQEVNRTGFGVETGADGGVSGVFQLSGDQINGLTQGLGGGQRGGGQGGGEGEGDGQGEGGLGGNTDMGALSGESNALTGALALSAEGLAGFSDGMGDLTAVASQQIAAANALASNANGITTTAELATILSGTYSYSGQGDFYTMVSSSASQDPAILGTVDASWSICFDTKSLTDVSITISSVNSGAIGESTAIRPIFAEMGDVLFSSLSPEGKAIFIPPIDTYNPSANNVSVEITLANVDGHIAQQGKINVNYYEDNGGTPPVTTWKGSGSFVAEASQAS